MSNPRPVRILLRLARAMFPAAFALCSALAQTPEITAVVNGMSFTPAVAPGGAVAVFGKNLSVSTQTCSPTQGLLPTVCGGAQVTFGGKAAAAYFVSASQLMVQAPFEAPPGRVDVVVQVQRSPQTTVASTPFAV